MSDYIPDDVLVEVFLRLPVIPLLICSKVCRKWYCLILNPNFISKHLKQTISNTNNKNRLLLVRHFNQFNGIQRLSLCFDNDTFDMHEELYCPFQRVYRYSEFIGTCNGLVCLAHLSIFNETIIIWNPCARKSVIVPKPVLYHPNAASILEFGFDSVNNDYKIVRLLYQINFPGDPHYCFQPNVEIYSLSTGDWKNISNVAPRYSILSSLRSTVFINGHVHWNGAQRCENGTFHNFLSAFDMSNEVFREVMIPGILSEYEALKLEVFSWDKSLALVEYENIGSSEFCWIWKMNEYSVVESWVRLVRVDLRGGLRRKVVSLQRTNEVIISDIMEGLFVYHPDTQQIQCLGIHGPNWSVFVDSFAESLVLAEGRKLEHFLELIFDEMH